MNKRKILSLAMALSIVAILAVGATLAYFTDTDAVKNVFTVGNVDIELIEVFDEEKAILMPGKDITKQGSIKNVGNQPAYVWAEILIPSELDDKDTNSPDKCGIGNSLHFNFKGANSVEYAQNTNADGKYYNADLSNLWYFQHSDKTMGVNCGYAGQTQVDGKWYNIMIALYKEPLAVGATTSTFNEKVYMDTAVEQTETEGTYLLLDGVNTYDGSWELIFRVYGIQAEGFENVFDAWKAYDGEYPATREPETTGTEVDG